MTVLEQQAPEILSSFGPDLSLLPLDLPYEDGEPVDWKGEYLGVEGTWLRHFTPEGTMVPTHKEAREAQALAAEQQITAERQRAATERQRVEIAQQHAEAEQQRADTLAQEVEALRNRLNAAGIDPDAE